MTDLDKLAKLKKKTVSLQREADKAQGSLNQLLAQLKEEFDCSDLIEAEALLVQFETEEKKAAKAFRKAMEKFEKEWSNATP